VSTSAPIIPFAYLQRYHAAQLVQSRLGAMIREGRAGASFEETERFRRSRWRDGVFAALCLVWSEQVRNAAEISREANLCRATVQN
jgi:hypothetical protein